MLGFKDDQGQPIALTATGLVCVVPPSMYFCALEAVSATLVASTTNVLQGAARVIAFPWLADASKWYLLKTDNVIRPFIFQDRVPLELIALESQSDVAFLRDKYLYGTRARYALNYAEWACAVSIDF